MACDGLGSVVFPGLRLPHGILPAFPVGITVAQGLSSAILVAAFHPVYQQGSAQRGAIAVVSTLADLRIAMPLAWVAARYRFRGKRSVRSAGARDPAHCRRSSVLWAWRNYSASTVPLNSLLTERRLLSPSGQGPDWLGDHRFRCGVHPRSAAPLSDPLPHHRHQSGALGSDSCWRPPSIWAQARGCVSAVWSCRSSAQGCSVAASSSSSGASPNWVRH